MTKLLSAAAAFVLFAPIATAIRNGSGLNASLPAMLAAMGAITRTVAALLRKGVSAMAAIRISPSAPSGGRF